MRQRSVFSLIAIGAIALLLIGAAISYWLLPRNTITTRATIFQPNAAIFVPKQAPIMVSTLVNPQGLGIFSQLQTTILGKSGINYQKDIQPWLGEEITLAVTTPDIDRDEQNGLQAGYLLALATAQPSKSREFVDLLFSQRVLAGNQLAVEEYQGVKLIYDHPQSNSSPDQKPLASALVGDSFVLFANDPKILREAINNVQAPEVNLLSSPQYQKAIQQLPQEPLLGTIFLNYPAIAQWRGLQLVDPVYDSQIIALKSSSKGLLAESTILATSSELPISASLSTPAPALKFIPDTAGLVITGKDLSHLADNPWAQFWTQLTTTISTSKGDTITPWVKPLADIKNRWGIELSQDIFSWVRGEYALGLLPSSSKKAPDWILVVDKLDGEAGIERLNKIAAKSGLSLNSFSLNQQKLVSWTQIQAGVNPKQKTQDKSFNIAAQIRGLHTTVGDYEIFTSSVAAMDKVLTTGENGVTKNPAFQNSLNNLSAPNQGYAYLNWKNGQDILKQELPIIQVLSILGKPFFSKFLSSSDYEKLSLTFSGDSSNAEFVKGYLFLQIES
jgi:hypothetical protein